MFVHYFRKFTVVSKHATLQVLVVAVLAISRPGWATPEPSVPQPSVAATATTAVPGSNLLPSGAAALLSRVGEQIGQARQVVNTTAADLISTAMGFLGVPYRRGGTDINGFDCSGFVVALYKESLGLVLPRTAAEQANSTKSIDVADLQPGDLVFFNTMRRAFSHVGVYVGDGKFIHAPRTGAQVRVDDMGMKYWQTRFDGARRVATGTSATTTP